MYKRLKWWTTNNGQHKPQEGYTQHKDIMIDQNEDSVSRDGSCVSELMLCLMFHVYIFIVYVPLTVIVSVLQWLP